MKNFEFTMPTRFILNENVDRMIGQVISSDGFNRILLVCNYPNYLVKSGIIENIENSLTDNDIYFEKISGIEPNPRIEKVYEGINLVKDKKLQAILSIGGGSIIDTGKSIAFGSKNEDNFWEYFDKGKNTNEALANYVFMTNASSGSEASNVAMINNTCVQKKGMLISDSLIPKVCFMDPYITESVPFKIRMSGIMDMLSHILERYFTSDEDEVDIIDDLCLASSKRLIEIMNEIANDGWNPTRSLLSELMWTSIIAQNDLLGIGRKQEWSSHLIANELSSVYDINHGYSLSVIMPAWMEYISYTKNARLKRFLSIFSKTDRKLDTEEDILLAIEKFRGLLNKLSLPTYIEDLDIKDIDLKILVDGVSYGNDGSIGNVVKLDKKDVEKIYFIADKNKGENK